MASRLALTLSAVAAASSLIACALVADLELPKFVAASDGGGSDAVAGEAGAKWDPCNPTLPKPVPAPASDELEKYVFAVQYVATKLKSAVAADATRLCGDPAIDLDGVETCKKGPDGKVVRASCTPRSLADNCDPEGGGDNAAGSLLLAFSGKESDPRDDANPFIAKGTGGMIFELTGYTGRDDDQQISLTLFAAVGVRDPVTQQLGKAPAWDGNDLWVGEKGSFTAGGEKPAYVGSGFVTGGVLVARFEKAPVTFGNFDLRLSADEFVVTGLLIRDEAGRPTRIDRGRIGLRISIETALEYAGGRLADGKPLCDPAGVRKNVLTVACGAADLPVNSRVTDPDAPCGALSYAMGFYAARAQRADHPHPEEVDAGSRIPCQFQPWPPDASADQLCAEVF